MEIISVGSSSSGNSYIIKAGDHTVILDVGLPAKRIRAALEESEIAPEDVEAVMITHEHTDHVKSVRAISRLCCNAKFYASRGTIESASNFQYLDDARIHILSAGDTVTLSNSDEDNSENYNDITISAFTLSHDAAEPLGFAVISDEQKLAVVTDTGIVTDEIYDAVSDADILVFEANHDLNMLMYGEYPYPLKMRIKGDFGHLSNEYAGEVLARMLAETFDQNERKKRKIMLAHLSFHNNAPIFARQTVEETLEKSGFTKGEDYTLDVASKEELTVLTWNGESDEW